MEILAPAGHKESVYAAVNSGADSIYLGMGKFNARRNARNFDENDLKEAIKYCRINGVKVYLTLNTVMLDEEKNELLNTARIAYRCGVDAFIVQDLGVFSLMKKAFPSVPVHASTQMGIHNVKGAEFVKKLGFKRVVLAREMQLSQIEEIISNVDIETEVFVHGSLCMCVSGFCYLSAMIGGRSANRGFCAQPCRLPFASFLPCPPSKNKNLQHGHVLSLKDLSAMDMILRLKELGVTSIKIEGRMKRPEYVAAAVNTCYNIMREKEDGNNKKILQSVFSRGGFTNGYLEDSIAIESIFGIRSKDDVMSANEKLFKKIREFYKEPLKRITVAMTLKIHENMPSVLTVEDGNGNTETTFGEIPEKALNKPITRESALLSLSKLGGTPYILGDFKLEKNAELNLSLSSLNKMRRDVITKLDNTRSICELNTDSDCNFENFATPTTNQNRSQMRTEKEQIKYRAVFKKYTQIPFRKIDSLEKIILPVDEVLNYTEKLESIKNKIIISLPKLLLGTENEERIIKKISILKKTGINKIYAENLSHIQIGSKTEIEIFGGFNLNICNCFSVQELINAGVKDITLSVEITRNQINKIYDTYSGRGEDIRTGAVIYGRIPLMLMRNCPVKEDRGGIACKACATKIKGTNLPFITDRMRKKFPVVCEKKYGYTELLNTDILYLADKKEDFNNLNFGVFLFNGEDRDNCGKIIEQYTEDSKIPDGMNKTSITRGLYYRGVK